jgi:tetratricopeptide (TPR) repeat protein
MSDLAKLRNAVSSDPLNADLRYLLGAELASSGEPEQAVVEISTALRLKPSLHAARFQLGLLYLTMARVPECFSAWQPLDSAEDQPCLKLFKDGMQALIRDDFRQCIDLLNRGIALNTTNAPLNRDMQMIIGKAQAALDAQSGSTSEPAQPESAALRTDFSLYSQTRQ